MSSPDSLFDLPKGTDDILAGGTGSGTKRKKKKGKRKQKFIETPYGRIPV